MSTAVADTPTRELPEWITSDTLYEIIDGEFVEKEPMSVDASRMATRLARLINNHAIDQLGEASTETMIELPGSTRRRRPDLVFVSYQRWPKGKSNEAAAWAVIPEACIEVVSPTDRFDDIMEKKDEYFEGGVSQVWILSPVTKFLQIYTSPTQSHGYRAGEVIDCSAIIPGFQFNLADVL